jgi:alpha-1,2-mannosyltransferase
MRILLTALLLSASAAGTALSVAALPFYDYEKGEVQPLVFATAGLWVLFALAVLSLRRVPARASVVLVLVGSLAIGVAAMAGPPNTSTDSARYAWDGIVQNAGVSPYRYVPADAHLEHLRTEWLFPAPVESADGTPECSGERIMRAKEPGSGDVVCTAINRATVPTIYPPASELVFAAVRLFTGPGAEYWPMQLLGLLTSLAVTALLLRTLVASGRDPRWAALWGWCPLVATEGVTNSHIDIVSALLLLLATVLVAAGRRWAGGVGAGAVHRDQAHPRHRRARAARSPSVADRRGIRRHVPAALRAVHRHRRPPRAGLSAGVPE